MIFFASNLTLLRKHRNVSQSDLARMLNKRQTAISSWENNIAQPSLEDIQTLTDFFNISIDEFVNQDLSILSSSSPKRKESSSTRATSNMPSATTPCPHEEKLVVVQDKLIESLRTNVALLQELLERKNSNKMEV